MEHKNILSVKNLKKIYSNKQTEDNHALNDLNLDVKEGEIFGLLGPNGAGKTTFINILAGTVIKTAGQVNVWGCRFEANAYHDFYGFLVCLQLEHYFLRDMR